MQYRTRRRACEWTREKEIKRCSRRCVLSVRRQSISLNYDIQFSFFFSCLFFVCHRCIDETRGLCENIVLIYNWFVIEQAWNEVIDIRFMNTCIVFVSMLWACRRVTLHAIRVERLKFLNAIRSDRRSKTRCVISMSTFYVRNTPPKRLWWQECSSLENENRRIANYWMELLLSTETNCQYTLADAFLA